MWFTDSPCTAYCHSDADLLNQSLLEANIATEVCLTVLDTLSIFIMGFKVHLQPPISRFPNLAVEWYIITKE